MYSPDNIFEELERAKTMFLMAHMGLSNHKKVLLPKILEWYTLPFSPPLSFPFPLLAHATAVTSHCASAFGICPTAAVADGKRHCFVKFCGPCCALLELTTPAHIRKGTRLTLFPRTPKLRSGRRVSCRSRSGPQCFAICHTCRSNPSSSVWTLCPTTGPSAIS